VPESPREEAITPSLFKLDGNASLLRTLVIPGTAEENVANTDVVAEAGGLKTSTVLTVSIELTIRKLTMLPGILTGRRSKPENSPAGILPTISGNTSTKRMLVLSSLVISKPLSTTAQELVVLEK
jgi:hypothetical protein